MVSPERFEEDFFSGAFLRDPYPYYSYLRANHPAYLFTRTGAYWFTRYDDVSTILYDYNRFGKSVGGREGFDGGGVFGRTMLFVDPPDHTRLRRLVSQAFTARVVESLKPRIWGIARGLLSGVDVAAGFDVVSGFASPLPALVIAELLGVPAEDRERFKEWSDRIIQLLDVTRSTEEHGLAVEAVSRLAGYFSELIEDRRSHRRGDLISLLIDAEEGGDALSHVELLGMCMLLLVAGHETTANLIANGFYTLLTHPDQLRLLGRRRELVPQAVEELLRFEPPVHRTARLVLEDTVLRGVRLKRGALVVAVIAAANRDPEVFANPDQLDVERRSNPHLSFGKGIHFCLGAPLARAEANIAFNVLLDALPSPRLDGEVEWSRNTLIRGVRRLRVVG